MSDKKGQSNMRKELEDEQFNFDDDLDIWCDDSDNEGRKTEAKQKMPAKVNDFDGLRAADRQYYDTLLPDLSPNLDIEDSELKIVLQQSLKEEQDRVETERKRQEENRIMEEIRREIRVKRLAEETARAQVQLKRTVNESIENIEEKLNYFRTSFAYIQSDLPETKQKEIQECIDSLLKSYSGLCFVYAREKRKPFFTQELYEQHFTKNLEKADFLMAQLTELIESANKKINHRKHRIR